MTLHRSHQMTAILAMALCLLLSMPACRAEEADIIDAFYPLEAHDATEEEEVYFCRDSSYYSGAPVYKGTTSQELPGACVLHSAAVLISNLKNTPCTAQEAALANNKGYNSPRNWTSIVVWGRIAGAFSVQFQPESMSEYRARLKARGVKKNERSELMLDKLRQMLETHGDGIGLMLHFNSTGKPNGDGRMHTVVLIGYVKKGDKIVDLIVNDCNVAPPEGVCVRLCDSTLPKAMIGERKLTNMTDAEVITALMETIVTCRWVVCAD